MVLIGLPGAGCSNNVPAYTRRHFGNCYSGDSTGLAARLDLGGFYRYYQLDVPNNSRRKQDLPGDSSECNVLFFENGNFVLNVDLRDAITGEHMYPSHNARVEVDTVWLRHKCWGIYRLAGDTIIGQYLYPSRGTIASFGGWESRYLILGRTRLQYLDAESRPFFRMTANDRETLRHAVSKRTYTEANLVPLTVIPPVQSWLNREPWLRCK